ncbi:hypothetical protein MNBD_UNCLBAC01-633 [hydrothermal vent metagenome]|uniref:Organic solvent tolerance-like N-terminal domain-containing protein n=1 Tax=hydrothermal vent metagenome TaxID=652676 RepID=A0A3B1DHC4_9ZZZZ
MIKKMVLILGIFFMCVNGLHAQEETEQKFEGFNLQGYTNEGVKAWNVNGDTADIIGNEIKINNVDADTYGEQVMNLKAGTGTVDQVSGNMFLETDVVITSETGTQLITDSLDWNRDKDLVTTKDNVTITDNAKGMVITGTGMKAQPGLNTAQINENVTAMIDTEMNEAEAEKKIVTITCDGPMIINRMEGKATFSDNVVAVQNDQTLKADRLEIYFNLEDSAIRELIGLGNVVVIRGENETYAQKLVYNVITEKMVLSGRPKLILLTEGENAITAPGN